MTARLARERAAELTRLRRRAGRIAPWPRESRATSGRRLLARERATELLELAGVGGVSDDVEKGINALQLVLLLLSQLPADLADHSVRDLTIGPGEDGVPHVSLAPEPPDGSELIRYTLPVFLSERVAFGDFVDAEKRTLLDVLAEELEG